ncbi:MAG: hypothetical protein R3F62_00580 [Planctomycetota bacterium]
MRIPRFWHKATRAVRTPDGANWDLEAWGWSDAGVDAAAAQARSLLQAQAEAIAAGRPKARYLYHDRPLREEVLAEPLPGVLVTRTRYGAQVLNAARAAFVDVDLEVPRAGLLRRLFRRGPSVEEQLDERLELLRVATEGLLGARVYRTHSGLRLLLTDRPYVPDAPETLRLLETLGSDPLYRTLCRAQACFRARLTPKPWRCGLSRPPCRWPYRDPDAMARWVERYERASEGLASARLLTHLGSGEVHPEVAPVVALHDHLTGAERDLPLA